MLAKIKSFLKFISLLRVEVFMFFTATSLYIRITPLDLLIQDKICRHKYNLSDYICKELPTFNDSISDKSAILSEAVNYNMYQNIIQYAPGIVWALFLGAWIDKYNEGRKAVFIIGSTTQFVEAIINWLNAYYFDSDVRWVLLSFVPYILSGSMTWSTAYSYVAATTPPHLTALRMMVLETVVAIAHLVGVMTYGRIINESPVWGNGQIHNHALVFFISALSAFIAFVWTLVFINQQKDKQSFDQNFGNDSTEDQYKIEEEEDHKYNRVKNRRHALRLLFDWNNVKEVFITCFKKRPNNSRAQIWFIIGGIFTYLFVLVFVPSIEFQFIEKIYKWDAKEFSFWESMGLIANSVFVLTFTPLLVKVFKVNDMVLALIGFSGLMLRMIVLAIILSPTGYFISIVFSCTTWMADVGLRAHLSRNVKASELGRIFTLLTIVDGVVPPIASTLSAHIFRATIDTFPGLCYILAAVVCVFAMIIVLIIIRLNKTNSNRIIANN